MQRILNRLIAPAKGKEGTPMIFTITDEVERKRTMQIHHIPFHLIDYANTLKKVCVLFLEAAES